MKSNWRLSVGVALLILGLVMPVGTLLVEATDWHGVMKTFLNLLLLFGLQLMAIPAVALMGKNTYDRIVQRVLKTVKPGSHVGRVRY